MKNPFKKKPYHNPSVFITAKELSLWLEAVPDDTTIKLPNGLLMKDMYYHEITGVQFS